MSGFWALKPFSLGIRKNTGALGNTKEVWEQAARLRASSPLAELDDTAFAGEVLAPAIVGLEYELSTPIVYALIDLCKAFYADEALAPLGENVLALRPDSRDAMEVREYLRRQIRFIENYDPAMAELQSHLTFICRYLLDLIPGYALEENAHDAFFRIRFASIVDDAADAVENVMGNSFDEELIHFNLLDPLRHRLEANLFRASKIDPRNVPSNHHRFVTPKKAVGLDAQELVDTYLVGTPFRQFFNMELPLAVNDAARFEHTHIMGGTGHGKTQFLQKWILRDLGVAVREKRSVVVVDSQGDMIQKISRLDVFHPDHGALKDKLVMIDPTDVLYPAAINMFALDEKRLNSYGAVEREKVQNSAIALYEHFFGELLGAELTAKQGVVFKYLARLMLEIPNATILTLRDLMDDPKPFIPYMDKLTGSARVFFAREFLDKSFNQTKRQISKRLWGVLSTPAFERLFSSQENKIDLYSKLNDGSIILINTAKDLLKQDGASLYGRFFLSMIGQAIMERAVIPEGERTPTYLYVDECQDYFDETIEVLLAQGRKRKIGLILAHQHTDQLSTSERASVLANTSIKACGGVNAKDAWLLAQEMRTSSDFLQSMSKSKWDTDFAFWIRHDVPEAIRVSVIFGLLESQKQMDQVSFEKMLTQNRKSYCWKYEPQDSAQNIVFPGMGKAKLEQVAHADMLLPTKLQSQPEGQPEITGRGGKEHTRIQNMVKSLANQYGWKADLEYQVADGAIDVWMSRAGLCIACEITVTTPNDYEVQNIEKCLAAGADEVWVISEDITKLQEIEKMIAGRSEVKFFTPDNLPAEIEARSDLHSEEGSTVRGYSVAIKMAYATDADLEMRREQLARVLKSAE